MQDTPKETPCEIELRMCRQFIGLCEGFAKTATVDASAHNVATLLGGYVKEWMPVIESQWELHNGGGISLEDLCRDLKLPIPESLTKKEK